MVIPAPARLPVPLGLLLCKVPLTRRQENELNPVVLLLCKKEKASASRSLALPPFTIPAAISTSARSLPSPHSAGLTQPRAGLRQEEQWSCAQGRERESLSSPVLAWHLLVVHVAVLPCNGWLMGLCPIPMSQLPSQLCWDVGGTWWMELVEVVAGETWRAAGRGNTDCHKSFLQRQSGAGIPCRVLAKPCTLSWHCVRSSGQDLWLLLATLSSNWQSLATQENDGMTIVWCCSVGW